MQVDGYKQDEFFIVKVSGRMDAITAPEFEKTCLEWIQQGESTLVVDLEGLQYMSSAGLRSILIVGKKLKSVGGTFSFCSLTSNVAHVFSISNFGSMFRVHDSLHKALGNGWSADVDIAPPAHMESLESFRSFVLRELGREKGLDGLAPWVDLILEEILVNAINYAYPSRNGEIEVECMAEGPEMFRVTVRDWGVPLNPLDQPAPELTTDIANRPVGGLGIYLPKQMASRLTYDYRDGAANTLPIWIGKEWIESALLQIVIDQRRPELALDKGAYHGRIT